VDDPSKKDKDDGGQPVADENCNPLLNNPVHHHKTSVHVREREDEML
jgi:hypothetical protein